MIEPVPMQELCTDSSAESVLQGAILIYFDCMRSVTILMESTCMSWALTCEKLHSEQGYSIDLKTFEGTLEGNTHCSKRSHDHIRSHPFASILCTLLESWCFGLWHHSSSITLMWRFLTWREKYLLGALHVPYKPVNLRMLHQYIIYLLPGRCFMRVAAQDMLLWAHVILHAVLGKLFIVINRVPKMTLAQWKLSWFTISSPRTFQKKLRWGIGMVRESDLLSCSKSNILKCKASMVLCTNWNGQLQSLRFSLE